MAFITFGGIGELTATYRVASSTTPTIGMAVALTGNGEVGVATEDTAIHGIIKHVNGNGLVTVIVKGYVENVPMSTTTSKQPAVGNVVSVDGKGNVIKSTAFTSGPVAVEVDAAAKTATILL